MTLIDTRSEFRLSLRNSLICTQYPIDGDQNRLINSLDFHPFSQWLQREIRRLIQNELLRSASK